MIQRIQSLYLSLTILISFLFLKGSNLNFIDKSGTLIKVTISGIFRSAGGQGFESLESVWPLSVVIILIPVTALITILLFRNRRIQLLCAISGIVLAAGFVLLTLYYTYAISTNYVTKVIPGFKMVIQLILLILNYLAYRGIRKDDKLVKSYDRLR